MKKLLMAFVGLLILVGLLSKSGVCQVGMYDYRVDGSSKCVSIGYRSWRGVPGRYTRFYLGCFPDNAGKVTVTQYAGGLLLRVMWVPPGGSIFDDLGCDSIAVLKDVATDSISFGGGAP